MPVRGLQGQGQDVLAASTDSKVLASASRFVPLCPHQKNGDKEFPPAGVGGGLGPIQLVKSPVWARHMLSSPVVP